MTTYGVEIADQHGARYAEIDGVSVAEAFVCARQKFERVPGNRVLVVFTLTGPYEAAVRQDYTSATGSGDPH